MTLQAYRIANTASEQFTSHAALVGSPAWSEYSAWMTRVAEQICRLRRLPANWDSYGAVPPSKAAVELMADILADVMNPNAPAPTLVPSPQGHLQAEWHMKGINLEVEAIDPTHIVVDYEGPGGHWTDTLRVDFRRLVQAINRLSR